MDVAIETLPLCRNADNWFQTAIRCSEITQGLKADCFRQHNVQMRRILLFAVLFGLLLPVGQPLILLEDEVSSFTGVSGIAVEISNGPIAGEAITGSNSLAFTTSGTGTLVNLSIEISDNNSDWVNLVTLTSSPWVYVWNSNSQDNGTWYMRAYGYDSEDNMTAIVESGAFTIANQIPVITSFALASAITGSGTSPTDRAWFNLSANGTLEFTWSASDDDLAYATLANVPGSGSPASDGPTTISHSWSWSPGDFGEGTWNPRLTVYDDSGLYVSSTMYIGIDRSGPSIATPNLANGVTWSDSTSVTISGLTAAGGDGGGSGIDRYEWRLSGGGNWSSLGASGTGAITLPEGQQNLEFRGVDIIGNIGSIVNASIGIDTTNPSLGTWTVDELNTSRIGSASISFSASDLGSGIDLSACNIQYGFDSNGAGNVPDVTNSWLDLGTTGLSGAVGIASWTTKSHQYLALRATVVDAAGNSLTSTPSFFQVLPGLDISWEVSSVELDRLVLRPGNDQLVWINSTIRSNEAYPGSVTIELQSAPADRTADVAWTTMETRTLQGGSLLDSEEDLLWNYTVASPGQWDLRVVIDPNNIIDERDEGNNHHYLVVTGVSEQYVSVVPSFAPSLLALVIVGFFIAFFMRRERE